jgi:hypothetical protein
MNPSPANSQPSSALDGHNFLLNEEGKGQKEGSFFPSEIARLDIHGLRNILCCSDAGFAKLSACIYVCKFSCIACFNIKLSFIRLFWQVSFFHSGYVHMHR